MLHSAPEEVADGARKDLKYMPNAYGNNAFNVPPLNSTGVKTGLLQLGSRINTNFGPGRIVNIVHPGQMEVIPNYNAIEPFVVTVLLDGCRVPVQLYLSNFAFQSNVGGQLTAQEEYNSNL